LYKREKLARVEHEHRISKPRWAEKQTTTSGSGAREAVPESDYLTLLVSLCPEESFCYLEQLSTRQMFYGNFVLKLKTRFVWSVE